MRTGMAGPGGRSSHVTQLFSAAFPRAGSWVPLAGALGSSSPSPHPTPPPRPRTALRLRRLRFILFFCPFHPEFLQREPLVSLSVGLWGF